jgi:beta-mannanase
LLGAFFVDISGVRQYGFQNCNIGECLRIKQMVAITSSAQVFTGYQGPAAAAQKPAQTAEAGNVSDTDRAVRGGAAEITRKEQSLQNSYDKKERRIEENYANASRNLEREFQQQKTDLERELQQKKQLLKVNIYV